MILTDYLNSEHDITWDYARQCGVKHGVIRLPENPAFDVTDRAHWEQVYRQFTDFGIRPIIVEPMPNTLHEPIKCGGAERDACIDKVIRMLPHMDALNIRMICFNWMAKIGWLRTDCAVPERGGARVTGFDRRAFDPAGYPTVTAEQLWENYAYFLRAVLPYAEKHNIHLALHPDDPPVDRLGPVARIMISADNIEKAMRVVPSPQLGITFCQATFLMMGEDLHAVIPRLADKIRFVHFRNVKGDKNRFAETFHDNGTIDMAAVMRRYRECGIDVPIRVDHVPLMAGEDPGTPGYTSLGRLFAIGYLKGILDTVYGRNDDV